MTDDTTLHRQLIEIALAVAGGKPFSLPGSETQYRALILPVEQAAECDAVATRLGIQPTVFLGAALGLGTILMAQARQEAEAKNVEVPDGAPVN